MTHSRHECPVCDSAVTTESTCGGPFELPPTLYCVHDDDSVEMDSFVEAGSL